jgi:hypothetical protein
MKFKFKCRDCHKEFEGTITEMKCKHCGSYDIILINFIRRLISKLFGVFMLLLIAAPINPYGYVIPNSTIKLKTFRIDTAKYVGIPYIYGGNSDKGMDCSALVMNIYKDNEI